MCGGRSVTEASVDSAYLGLFGGFLVAAGGIGLAVAGGPIGWVIGLSAVGGGGIGWFGAASVDRAERDLEFRRRAARADQLEREAELQRQEADRREAARNVETNARIRQLNAEIAQSRQLRDELAVALAESERLMRENAGLNIDIARLQGLVRDQDRILGERQAEIDRLNAARRAGPGMFNPAANDAQGVPPPAAAVPRRR